MLSQMNLYKHQRGFTLLEVLVATFIFAVAITALLKVLGESANTLHHIEKKQFATLTAHNQLALAILGTPQTDGRSTNGGYDYQWKTASYPTPDSNISRLEVSVAEQGNSQTIAHLKAFRGTSR